jgi:hypothetical protein
VDVVEVDVVAGAVVVAADVLVVAPDGGVLVVAGVVPVVVGVVAVVVGVVPVVIGVVVVVDVVPAVVGVPPAVVGVVAESVGALAGVVSVVAGAAPEPPVGAVVLVGVVVVVAVVDTLGFVADEATTVGEVPEDGAWPVLFPVPGWVEGTSWVLRTVEYCCISVETAATICVPAMPVLRAFRRNLSSSRSM